MFPVLSFIAVASLPLLVFFQVNCLTFSYTRSDRPFLANCSNSLHSFSHHCSFALSVSLLSSLLSILYFVLPSSSFLLFHFLLSLILPVISAVIHGFLILFPFL